MSGKIIHYSNIIFPYHFYQFFFFFVFFLQLVNKESGDEEEFFFFFSSNAYKFLFSYIQSLQGYRHVVKTMMKMGGRNMTHYRI